MASIGEQIAQWLPTTWPAKLAQSAISGFTAPHDAMTGQLDPNTDEGLGRVFDMTGLMLGGGVAGAQKGALGAAGGELGRAAEEAPGIIAYHGSPHSFDHFDMSKIGTGEGAQSYGHGLYFAGNEDVAKSYRDKLSQEDSPGSMYQVKINADPERFLDWNAPPSAQSPSVQQALQSIPGWERAIGKDSGLPVGQLVNRGLLPATYDKAGPEFSKTYGGAGIPGVKYLDQGSRGVGEGSHNFVVFDDSMIQMLKKYGLAGVGAGAAGAGALGANDGQGQ